MSKETTAMTKSDAQTPAAQALATIGASAQDLTIPRLHLMQNTSEAVGEGKAKLGDILNLQTNQVVGDEKRPVEIIPLKMFKTWRVFDMTGKTPKHLREEPMTAANEKDPWEFSEGGKERRRDYGIHFFALLTSEVDADEAFPVLISFRRTSIRAGKALATQLFKQMAMGNKPYHRTAKVGVSKDRFESNTYALFEVQQGEKTNVKGLAAAARWLPLLDQMIAKVDFSKDVDESAAASASTAAKAPTVVSDGTPEEGPY